MLRVVALGDKGVLNNGWVEALCVVEVGNQLFYVEPAGEVTGSTHALLPLSDLHILAQRHPVAAEPGLVEEGSNCVETRLSPDRVHHFGLGSLKGLHERLSTDHGLSSVEFLPTVNLDLTLGAKTLPLRAHCLLSFPPLSIGNPVGWIDVRS